LIIAERQLYNFNTVKAIRAKMMVVIVKSQDSRLRVEEKK